MKQNYTDIIIVLDRSGSMQVVRTDTIGGVNKFIEEQQKVSGECRLSLLQFDDQYESVLSAVPIKDAKPLTEETYVPRGWTALHGAIGRTIEDTGRRFSAMAEHDRPEKVVFVIVTDGEENSTPKYEWSRRWDAAKIKQMIETQSGTFKWQFVYIGANQDAIANAAHVGIAAANAINYTQNKAGTEKLYAALSRNVTAMRCCATSNLSWQEKDREEQHEAATH